MPSFMYSLVSCVAISSARGWMMLIVSMIVSIHLVNADTTRVAFVFAGSVRSFIAPPVHLSIAHNLIDGFCPPPHCIGEVFARVSMSDNTHTGLNAIGNHVSGDHSQIDAVKRALRRLEKSARSEFVDFGSMDERIELEKFSKKSNAHRIYQDLDPRRYNMYFNRWSAYQMAVEYEKQNNIKFDWIVHARLDFIWGAPIRPYSAWSSQRVWVPDSWATDVPDTFAILPRNRADLYYSLDALYDDPHVACIGGPDFDPKTASDDALTARGYDSAMKKFVEDSMCLKRFREIHTVTSDNVVWSWAGVSEIVLRRKLEVNGIAFGNKKLEFASFFMVMVRQPLELICHYINPGSFIGWVHKFYPPNSAYSVGCDVMRSELNRARLSDGQPYGPNCDTHSMTTIAEPVDQPSSACLLDLAVTDWNFMPFRIRANELECLTENSTLQSLAFHDCRDFSEVSRTTLYYDSNQLFSLFPLSRLPQRIRFGSARCWTVLNTDFSSTPSTSMHHRMAIALEQCSDNLAEITQLFRMKLLGEYTGLSGAIRHNSNHHKQHLFDVSAVEIAWMGMSEHFCLTHRAAHVGHGIGHKDSSVTHMNGKNSTAITSNTLILLVPCNQTTVSLETQRKHHVFILERALNKSPIDYFS